MTEAEVARIAEELNLVLPSDYRHVLTHYPIRYAVGTTNEPVWDDADAIIERNRELRRPRRSLGVDYQPLPERFLFIGDDGAGWQNLLDLESPEPTAVYVMEFENVERISPMRTKSNENATLAEWFHDYLLELRDDGIDLSSEEDPSALSWGCIVGALAFCLVMAIVITFMTLGIQSLFQ